MIRLQLGTAAEGEAAASQVEHRRGPIHSMTLAQRLRGNAPDRYAIAIISSSQASRSAGVARRPIVSFCSSFAAQLPQSVLFSSAIALAPADRLQRFDVALVLGSVCELVETIASPRVTHVRYAVRER
jgi:hypothetical protein